MTAKLSSAVEVRLDAIANSDPEASAAVDAMLAALSQFDNRQNLDLHERLSGAFLDAMHAVQRAAWLDGWRCGRDPERLIFKDPALRHPDPTQEV